MKIARITWSTETFCAAGEITNDIDDRTILVQTDWDYPGVADTFGWSTRGVQSGQGACDHSETDGTVACSACGVTASVFIEAAEEGLDGNDGATVDDPGYFDD